MATAQTVAHKFVTGTYGLYERLVLAAFLDGVAQYNEGDPGQSPMTVQERDRQRAIRTILLYYLPGLVRLHNEALHIVLTAPDKVVALNTWFDKNRKRIEAAFEGMLWSASEAGLAAAAQVAGKYVDWNLDPVAEHCGDCPELADGSPYTFATLPGYPGSGISACGGRCKCWLSTVETPNLPSAQA